MIPTMILVGLLLGRWWRSCLVVGTLGWSILLLADGTVDSPGEALGAAALGLVNTLVGVAIHQVVAHLFRALRGHRQGTARKHA